MPKQSPLPMLEIYEDTRKYVTFFSSAVVAIFPLYPSHTFLSAACFNHHMLNHIFENFLCEVVLPKQPFLVMLDMYVHPSRYVTFFSSSVVAKFSLLSSHTHSSILLVLNLHILTHIFEHWYRRYSQSSLSY